MSKRKTSSVKQQYPGKTMLMSILKGSVIGLISFILLLTLGSLIIMKISVEAEYLFIIVLAASALSALIGAAATCINKTSKNLIAGMSSSIILILMEFIVLLCFNNSDLSNKVYFMIPIMLITGFIGCVIGSNIRKK